MKLMLTEVDVAAAVAFWLERARGLRVDAGAIKMQLLLAPTSVKAGAADSEFVFVAEWEPRDASPPASAAPAAAPRELRDVVIDVLNRMGPATFLKHVAAIYQDRAQSPPFGGVTDLRLYYDRLASTIQSAALDLDKAGTEASRREVTPSPEEAARGEG